MRRYNIALAVIEQGSEYILQRRGTHPNIGAAGLIGFFGGKVEKGEDTLKALCREVAEKTTLAPETRELSYLGEVSILMAHVSGKAMIDAAAYTLKVDSEVQVEAREWELTKIAKHEVKKYINELTPATRAVFEEILWR